MPCAEIQYVSDRPRYSESAWEDAALCTEPAGVFAAGQASHSMYESESWYGDSLEEIESFGLIFLKSIYKPCPAERFKELVKQWKEETWFRSSLKKRISHIAYLKIIGFGKTAIPWILEELQRDPDYWFPALEAITQIDAAPRAENMTQLREAWLEWGRANGYIS